MKITDEEVWLNLEGLSAENGEELGDWLEQMRSRGFIEHYNLHHIRPAESLWLVKVKFALGRGFGIDELRSNLQRFDRPALPDMPTERLVFAG